MAFDLEELLPFLRRAIDDRDSDEYDYPDEELRSDLRFGVIALESKWEQGYAVSSEMVGEGDNAKLHYFCTPDLPEWMQVLVVLETAYKIKAAIPSNSVHLPSISATNGSKEDDMKRLKEMIDDIIYERRYNRDNCFAYSTFDDYFTRCNLVFNELCEGYR
jgi:hypothetical protein